MTTGAMLRYPSMSIRLPHRMNEAPLGPDASSLDGSTLRPAANPTAAEYIPLAASSNPTAATANQIATRVETGLMLFGAFPGADEPIWLEFRLRDIRRCSAFRGARRVLRLLVGGKQQHHDGAVRVLEDLPGRLEAVDAGQVDVHQHQVRVQFLTGFDRGLTRLGFSDHLEAVGGFHPRPRRLTERRLIVDDRHSHGHVSIYRMTDIQARENGASTTSSPHPNPPPQAGEGK